MYNEKHERLTINQSKVKLGIVFYYIDVGRLRHIFRNHEFFILLVENFSSRYKKLASSDLHTRIFPRLSRIGNYQHKPFYF